MGPTNNPVSAKKELNVKMDVSGRESISIFASLVYEKHERVPRWIRSLSGCHINQMFSSGLHISGIDRNWLPISKQHTTF